MTTATIKKDGTGKGLYLITNLNNEILGTLFPITEDEVEAIRDACEEYLEIKSQEIMKNER